MELIFQKELMLIKQMHQKNDICHYWYFKNVVFRYEPYLCNGGDDLMQKATVLMMLLLFMLKEVLTEFIFGI